MSVLPDPRKQPFAAVPAKAPISIKASLLPTIEIEAVEAEEDCCGPASQSVERAVILDMSCSTPGCTAQRLGTAPTQTLLSVRDLSVAYGQKTALEDVDVDVHEGRVTALIGPSGCGKTSFLYTLNRLSDMVSGCQVDGGISFDGHSVNSEADVGWLRRNVGMVFQRPNPFPLSIRANLHLPLKEHGCPKAELDERTEQVLRQVGLWDEVCDRLDSSAFTLSGGQQQRLCIARALTLKPRLLLMDEPCSALDPLATEVIERLITNLRGAISIVIVTHNLAQARRVADDVIVFWNHGGSGCVIESGEAHEVFANPQQPDTVAYLSGRRG